MSGSVVAQLVIRKILLNGTGLICWQKVVARMTHSVSFLSDCELMFCLESVLP
jgi:hypothetical protein